MQHLWDIVALGLFVDWIILFQGELSDPYCTDLARLNLLYGAYCTFQSVYSGGVTLWCLWFSLKILIGYAHTQSQSLCVRSGWRIYIWSCSVIINFATLIMLLLIMSLAFTLKPSIESLQIEINETFDLFAFICWRQTQNIQGDIDLICVIHTICYCVQRLMTIWHTHTLTWDKLILFFPVRSGQGLILALTGRELPHRGIHPLERYYQAAFIDIQLWSLI